MNIVSENLETPSPGTLSTAASAGVPQSPPTPPISSPTSEINYRYKGQPYVNPFVHKLDLSHPLDTFLVYVCTVLLVPIRLVIIIICLLVAWILACIGLLGLTTQDLKLKPITGWRKVIQRISAFTMRGLFTAAGFNYIVYKGEQASSKEAPILCVAPHSSYVDSIVVVTLGPPSIVAKAETSELPFFGKLINYSQPIYVMREDPNSRHNTIREIVERANAKEEWPQIVIFPEGTCTNRSALITFKPGAFYPGVPVQPVLLRYSNRIDSYTWTWEGPGILKLLWITLTQPHNACEIEFLPVYRPSEEEKSNPKLFANNVRNVMAKALGVPISDFTYDDCKLMTKAKEFNIPYAADIVEIEKLGKLLGVQVSTIEEKYLVKIQNNTTNLITLKELAGVLSTTEDDQILSQLFSILDCNKTGEINVRDYVLVLIFLSKQNDAIIEFLREVFKLYSSTGILSKENFHSIMRHSGQISKEESDVIFNQISNKSNGNVNFDDFLRFVQQKPDYEWLFKIDGKHKVQ